MIEPRNDQARCDEDTQCQLRPDPSRSRDHHEHEPGLRWYSAEERLQRLEAARRSSNADDGRSIPIRNVATGRVRRPFTGLAFAMRELEAGFLRLFKRTLSGLASC